MLSDVCLSSVACIGPKSRTEKIDTEEAHDTCDSHTTFKVKRSRLLGRFTHRGVNASPWCSDNRGNILIVGTYCYVAVCRRGRSAARGASAPTEGGEGRGISWRPPARLQLVWMFDRKGIQPVKSRVFLWVVTI